MKFINNDNKTKIVISVFICLIGMFVAGNNISNNVIPTTVKKQVKNKIHKVKKDDWTLLKDAIIYVESRGNDSAVGTKCDVGCIQATPIYVKEVNRINKLKNIKKKYTLNDRKNRKLCMEMFETIQSHHNPEKDLIRAIKLHNPRAGKWYRDRVVARLNYLKENQN